MGNPLKHVNSGPKIVAGSVTNLELFFDLGFVFAITQLTGTIGHEHTLGGVGRVFLLLALIWWMYGGYAWMTNAAPPVTPRRRVLLLLGMAGNFVVALAIPHAFTSDRWAFALGYAVVVLVHAWTYTVESGVINRRLLGQVLGWNLAALALVFVGAALGGSKLVACWVAAMIVCSVLPRILRGSRGKGARDDNEYRLTPGHFVERHGLMLIIVLGESVLAIGVGVSTEAEAIGWAQVLFAVGGLALAALLFWSYFGLGEDQAAEEVLDEAGRNPGPNSQEVAFPAFGVAFGFLLFAMVLIAAGLHSALAHPLHHLDATAAAYLAGGVALFWLGLALFRYLTGRRRSPIHLLVAVAAAATAVLGINVAGIAELAALLLICGVALSALSRQPQGVTAEPALA